MTSDHTPTYPSKPAGTVDDPYDPLSYFIQLFEGRTGTASAKKQRPDTIEEVLKLRIVEGDRKGLEEDLATAMQTYTPLAIINDLLLEGMKVVGELFASGKMMLPFVLQAAETMKAAVAYLEPHMERAAGQSKGSMVLATVRGDVHDIGKNLVDIILTNNGYKVYNLGIKQPIEDILKAVDEYQPDAVGMSGLLVKSTVIMKENLEEMSRRGYDLPVILGGAALTRQFVEEDCVAAYASGRVAYAKDAFDGLTLMGAIVDGRFDTLLQEAQAKRQNRPSNRMKNRFERVETGEMQAQKATDRPIEAAAIQLKRAELAQQTQVPTPPFWGVRVLESVPVKALLPFLNEQMLFTFHWGYKKAGRTPAEHQQWLEREVRPQLLELLATCEQETILQPQAAYGYFPCWAEGDILVLFDAEDHTREIARFPLPRQAKENGICIADFFRDATTGEKDVIALQVVTAGQRVADVARDWFAADRYLDYVRLHGLGVEIAEALAEYVHKRIRGELGFSHEDARTMDEMLKQGYRGSRYSFGYPACPRLEDQTQLLQLLRADRIGISLSEDYQLHPEQSTSALVVHHPQAKYFNI